MNTIKINDDGTVEITPERPPLPTMKQNADVYLKSLYTKENSLLEQLKNVRTQIKQLTDAGIMVEEVDVQPVVIKPPL